MSEELKPCPFCGALEPQKIMFCDDIIGWEYILQCEFCSARITSHADMDDAIRKWNTRPSEEALKAEVEELAGYVKRFRETLAEVAQMANNSDQEQIFEKCRDALRDVYLEEIFRDKFDQILHEPKTEKGGEDEVR